MLNKARDYALHCIQEAVVYNKTRWDKTQKKTRFPSLWPSFSLNFQLQQPERSQETARFFCRTIHCHHVHGKNAVGVILTGDFDRKNPVFPASLLKKYKQKRKFQNQRRKITTTGDDYINRRPRREEILETTEKEEDDTWQQRSDTPSGKIKRQKCR